MPEFRKNVSRPKLSLYSIQDGVRMKRVISFVFCSLMVLPTIAIAQSWDWVRSAGGTGADYVSKVACDTNGNAFVVGFFTGTATFGVAPNTVTLVSSGGLDCYLAKYSSSGVLQWAIKEGSTGMDGANGVAVLNNGDVVVCGGYEGTVVFGTAPNTTTLSSNGSADMWIAKYSTNGLMYWAKSAGGSGFDFAVSAAVLADSIYICGGFADTCFFDAGRTVFLESASLTTSDAFVGKYLINGNHIWARGIGGKLNDLANSVAVASTGHVAVGGAFRDTCKWSGGGPVIYKFSAGNLDAYVCRFTGAGTLDWVSKGGGTTADQINCIFIHEDDGLICSAQRSEGYSEWVNGTDTFSVNPQAIHTQIKDSHFPIGSFLTGNIDVSESLPITNAPDTYMNPTFVARDNSSDTYFGGYFQGRLRLGFASDSVVLTNSGSSDIVFGKMNQNGSLNWAWKAGGTGNDICYHMTILPGGDAVAVGTYEGTATFGSSNLTSLGSSDIFIARIESLGNFLVSDVEGTKSLPATISAAVVGDILSVSSTMHGTISVVDVTGRIVVYGKPIGSQPIEINTASWAQGLYFIYVESSYASSIASVSILR